MSWHSPPTRRELSLVLFSLTIFILFYNLESSFTSSSSLSQAHAGGNREDDWDELIYGNWSWEEAEVAQNAQKQSQILETETTSSTVAVAAVSLHPHFFGAVGVNDGILDWGGDVPTTRVLKHVPGYTVMDNVFMLNGTVFVVTDDPAFPPLGSIASSSVDSNAVPRSSDWQILSHDQAKERLGPLGGVIHGVSWLVTDTSPSNYSLFSLWRTYSALDMSLSPDTLTLPPPRRIFYPNVPTFTGERPNTNEPLVERMRSSSGFHPYVTKAAFPTLGLLYREDWADYALMHVPFLIRRVVVADEGAAHRGGSGDMPAFAVPLVELAASRVWWEPIRKNVARFLDVAEEAPGKAWLGRTEAVVTYLSRQDAVSGPRLSEGDHEALVQALEALGDGFTVRVVASEAGSVEQMRAVAQSTVVIGVYGSHMADCVWMPPSSRTTVMEVFPPGVFVRDVAVAVRALEGVGYVAWWEGRQHGADKLPLVVPPPDEAGVDEVPIDVPAMMQAIRQIA